MKSKKLRMTNHKKLSFVLIACGALCVSSCTNVDYCDGGVNHDHSDKVTVSYEWGADIPVSVRPDSLFLLVDRPFNTQRVGYVTSAINSDGGRYRFGATVDSFALALKEGEYRFMAINDDVWHASQVQSANNDAYDYRFDNIAGYVGDSLEMSVGFSDLKFSYTLRKCTDARMGDNGLAWSMLASDAYYIPSDVAPVYFAQNGVGKSNQDVTISIEPGANTKVNLVMDKLTQDITFSFPIAVDASVTIKKALAEVSGVCSSITLATGVVHDDSTCNVLFEMEQKMLSETVCECTGTISVLGLLANPAGAAVIDGEGILRIRVDAVRGGQSKVLYAVANIHNLINEANLLVANENKELVRGTKEATLRLDGSRLRITKDLNLNVEGNATSNVWNVLRLD